MSRTKLVPLSLPAMFFAAATLACLAEPALAKGRRPGEAAAHVDKLLAAERESAGSGASAAIERLDDEGFLRRLSLDLLGVTPPAGELTAFVLDPDPEKRDRAIKRYLADARYGENWARYWRDVILYRRTDDRALLVTKALTQLLTERFNDNAGWDRVTREFFTATGPFDDNGATAVIASQWGETNDIASEYARIFLGIQIQCAQCHDHRTDRWKREQFHELAAFFPRAAVRPIPGPDGGKKRIGFQAIATDDPDGDGVARTGKNKGKGRGRPREHYMPDMDDPSAKGTLMQPAFFVTGQKLEPGASDAERRAALAEWVTAESNPWFAKALVNRVWAELTGRGFYEPIDDLGPDRDCTSPKVLEFLATQFRQHEFDLKWLYRTIALTDHYQRADAQQSTPTSSATVALCTCTQRLRADQLFNTLIAGLELPEPPAGGREDQPRRGPPRTPRAQFMAAFGFDPSSPDDDVQLSIPQALLLMNSPQLSAAISAKRDTALKRLLASLSDDEQLVGELYLRMLGREPRASEVQTCLEHVREVGARAEAFEDILWSLVNSTEFLYRN